VQRHKSPLILIREKAREVFKVDTRIGDENGVAEIGNRSPGLGFFALPGRFCFFCIINTYPPGASVA